MPDDDPPHADQIRLDRFADAALDLSLDLQRRALAADDNAQAADLADAFHKVGRSLRQTLALKARLRREASEADRAARKAQADEDQARRQLRRQQIAAALKGPIWSEYEADEAENVEAELEDLLDALELAEDFADQPLDAQLKVLRQTLDLAADLTPSSPTWGGGPRNAVEAASPAPALQSSA